MGICYHCGKELDEQTRCKSCNLTFCSEHLPPEAHNCIALSKDFKVKKGQEKTQKQASENVDIVEGEEPVTGVRPRSIKYLPVEDEETQVKEVKRRREPTGGVNRVRILFFLGIIAVGMWSINVLVSMSMNSGNQISPITFPTDAETLTLRESVLTRMNQERSRRGLASLSLDTNLVAQRYSETLATTDSFKYNPDLASGIKENIIRRDISSPFSAQGTLDQIVDAMMNDDAANNWVNRDAILNKDYSKVSLGVAWNNNYFYLVQDFSK
ncbi:MAG: CAP domain-containing protein [Candidatus Bathyarchaeota archaeon]|nr:CAP domain-containing protein [Candidatus Bathyarchaeota archaeon]